MAKVDIVRAAKRAGFTVIDAHYGWTPNPGEMVPEWEIKFQDNLKRFDPEVASFTNTADAVGYFRKLAAMAKGA